MKKILIALTIAVSFYSNAQETEFTFTSDKGMTDFIVTPVEGKIAPEIYKKIMEWIKITYKNPNEVILSTIENEYVRFEGASDDLICANGMGKMCYTAKYQIEISIKDGRYKFDLIGIKQLGQGNWYDVEIVNLEKYYKKNGELYSVYKYYPNIAVYFNNLNKSLFESITTTVKKNDNW